MRVFLVWSRRTAGRSAGIDIIPYLNKVMATDRFSYSGNSVGPGHRSFDSSIYGFKQQANRSLSSQSSQGETVAVVELCGDVKRR